MGKGMGNNEKVMNLDIKLLSTNYVALNIKEKEYIDDFRIGINVVS